MKTLAIFCALFIIDAVASVARDAQNQAVHQKDDNPTKRCRKASKCEKLIGATRSEPEKSLLCCYSGIRHSLSKQKPKKKESSTKRMIYPVIYDPDVAACISSRLISRATLITRTKTTRNTLAICVVFGAIVDPSQNESIPNKSINTDLHFQSNPSKNVKNNNYENEDDNNKCDIDENVHSEMRNENGEKHSRLIQSKFIYYNDHLPKSNVYCAHSTNFIDSNVKFDIGVIVNNENPTEYEKLKATFINFESRFHSVFKIKTSGNSFDEGIETIFLNFVSFLIRTILKISYIIICIFSILANSENGFRGIHVPEFLYRRSFTKFFESTVDAVCEKSSSGKEFTQKCTQNKELDLILYGNALYTSQAMETWSRNSYCVFPVKSNIERVASFSGFHNTSCVSFLKLSHFGFYYTGQDAILQCSDCGSTVKAKDVVSPPSDRRYHISDHCHFASTGDKNDIGKACESGVSTSPVGQIPSGSTDAELEIKTETEVVGTNPVKSQQSVKQEKPQTVFALFKQDTIRQQVQDTTSSFLHQSEGHIQPDESDKDETFGARCMTGNENLKRKPFVWIDQKHFRYEAANAKDASPNTCPSSFKCSKNENHSNSMSLRELTLDQIPAEMRNDDIKNCVLKVAELTVNVVVGQKSPERPNIDMENMSKEHFGSGLAYVDGLDNSEKWMKEDCKNEMNLNHPQYVYPRERFYFAVVTSRHVVFDQYEAKHTKIEFFYDSDDRKGVVSVSGVDVKHSLKDGEYKSHLVCETSDRQFFKWLCRARQELKNLMDRMQQNAREMLVKNCIVVFHPYGSEKGVSFGRSAVVKYNLVNNDAYEAKEMVYLNNRESLSKAKEPCEVLLYNASTCPGSSGSPVVTFRRTRERSEGTSKLSPYLWVHNGMEMSTKLGGSTMTSIDPLFQSCDEPLPLTTLVAKLHESSTSEASKPTSTTVSEGLTPPLYPQFYTWRKRLSSYNDSRYKSRCDHTPLELALGGFFFTGASSDCVRCFYCGLGLKSWRPGDDMIVEHQRARPSCGFLKLCAAWKGRLDLDMLKEATNISVFPTEELTLDLTISLLEKENRLLKMQRMCRMCFRHEIRELFLPCGEILTCEQCSEILSMCPSCGEKIEATVSVYLS